MPESRRKEKKTAHPKQLGKGGLVNAAGSTGRRVTVSSKKQNAGYGGALGAETLLHGKVIREKKLPNASRPPAESTRRATLLKRREQHARNDAMLVWVYQRLLPARGEGKSPRSPLPRKR